MTTKQHNWILWAIFGILCVFYLQNLRAFPPFIDEGFFIAEAEQTAEQGPFYSAQYGRTFTVWAITAVQAYRNDGLLTARAIVLLAYLPTIAASIGIGRLMGGLPGACWAAALIGFNTLNFTFARLAISDTTATAAVMVAVYFAYRLSVRRRLWDAVWCGVALFIAVGFKLSVLVYLGVPIAAAISLFPRGESPRKWRVNALWAGVALLVGGGLSALFSLILAWRGYGSIVSLFFIYNPEGIQLGQIPKHLITSMEWYADYLSLPFAVAAAFSVLWLVARRQWFLPLCFVGPGIVFWLNSAQFSRYYLTPMTLLSMCLVAALIDLSHLINRRRVTLSLHAAATVWIAAVFLPFVLTAYSDPSLLPLPQRDMDEYLLGDSSGAKLDQVLAVLREEGAELVIGGLANCNGLRFTANNQPEVICPKLNPSDAGGTAVQAMFAADPKRKTYAVLESLPYVPQSVNGTLLVEIERAYTRFAIYRLGP